MGKYVLRRLLIMLPLLLGVLTITFGLMHLLPGDPASIMLAKSGASADRVARLRQEMGLNDPIYVQYWRYLSHTLQGDLGQSLADGSQVIDLLATRIPKTLQLALAALAIAVPLGTLLGVLSAVYQDKWVDRVLVAFSSLGVSMPSFWLGLMLILLFSVKLHWLPASGQGTFRHLILPASVLGFGALGSTTRTARSSMVDVLRQDYMRTARAKGLAEALVLVRHALRNALIPVVTMVGLQFGWLISGSVIVETVFARQGLGLVLVTAIMQMDLPVVQGGVLLSAVMYLSLNLVVDLTYGFIDPRIRYE
jgi:peptide/nickel transport system permease protein